MTDLREDMKQLKGHARCRNGWVLPKAILVVVAVILLATTIAKFRSTNGKFNPGGASQTSAAVLIKKLPRPSDENQMLVDADADAQAQAALRAQTIEHVEPVPPREGLDREIPTRAASPEQAELEKLMDWMVKRRSPKY